jgi:uncharacterized protein YbbC (DUF1343 family)
MLLDNKLSVKILIKLGIKKYFEKYFCTVIAQLFDQVVIFSLMIFVSVPGVERIPLSSFLHKARLGMLTNEAARTRTGQASRQFLLEHGFRVTRLFSPEHGLSARGPDGETVADGTDSLTGLRVVSLYGEKLKPFPEQLEGLEAVLFDIPDVGCRFYTYLWSMTYMMEACAEAGLPFVVLDRANPIGGNLEMAEGPMLDELHCSSFIGRWDIPIRHCCTLGELARYFQATRIPSLKLEVIPCSNWIREKSFFEAFHPFTHTSPAIRDAETVLLYPGTGLLEGVNINEGRGTLLPFKQAGAPWVDAAEWKNEMEKGVVKGVQLTEVYFVPEWGMYAGETCSGLRFDVVNASVFRPVSFGISLVSSIIGLYPQQVSARLYPTAVNPAGIGHADRLTGVNGSFEKLRLGETFITDVSSLWPGLIRPYLLYG